MGALLSKADKIQKRQKLKDAIHGVATVVLGAALGTLVPKAINQVNEKVVKPYNDKHRDEADEKAAEIEEKLMDEFLLKYADKMRKANYEYAALVEEFNSSVEDLDEVPNHGGFVINSSGKPNNEVEFIVQRTWSGSLHSKSGKVRKDEVNPNIVDMPFRILHVLDPTEGTARKMGDMVNSLDKDKKLDMFLNKNDGKTDVKNDNFKIVMSWMSAAILECRDAITAVYSERVAYGIKHPHILSSEDLKNKYSTSKLDKKQKEIADWYNKNINDIKECGKNIEKLYTADGVRKLVSNRADGYSESIKQFLKILAMACDFYKSVFDMLNELIKDIEDMDRKIREPFNKVKSVQMYDYKGYNADVANAGKSYAKNKKNKE